MSSRAARQAWLFCALSFLMAVGFLAVRNPLDDEIASLDFSRQPARAIVAEANSADVHPPGMYLLARAAYLAVRSDRWMTLPALILFYLGLGAFLAAFAPHFPDPFARFLFLGMAALHPQILMWTNCIRWFPWWTGIALLILAAGLPPSRFGFARGLSIGALLAACFYINYITLPFAAAFFLAALIRHGRKALSALIAASGVALVLCALQLPAFLHVHLASGESQRAPVAASLFRVAQALLFSEAFLPWHPLALLFAASAGLALAFGFRGLLRQPPSSPTGALLLFGAAYALLAVLTGLAAKPRNLLLLIPVFAAALAFAASVLPARVRYLFAAIAAMFVAMGYLHLAMRYGTAKGGMNDHYEEAVRFIRQDAAGRCALVTSSNPVLTYELETAAIPRLTVISMWDNATYTGAAPFQPGACPAARAYVVESYLGALFSIKAPLQQEESSVKELLTEPVVTRLGLDPDATLKRRLPVGEAAVENPDYRFVITSGNLSPGGAASILSSLCVFRPVNGSHLFLLPVIRRRIDACAAIRPKPGT